MRFPRKQGHRGTFATTVDRRCLLACTHLAPFPLHRQRSRGDRRRGFPGTSPGRSQTLSCRTGERTLPRRGEPPDAYGVAFSSGPKSAPRSRLLRAIAVESPRQTVKGLSACNPFRSRDLPLTLRRQSSTQKTTTSLGPWTPTMDCISMSALREGPLIRQTLCAEPSNAEPEDGSHSCREAWI